MKYFVIAAILILCVAEHSNQLQAGLLDDVVSVPRRVMAVPRRIVNVELNRLTYPIIDMSRTIPAPHEVATFPSLRRGQVLAYPVNLVRYVVRVHPGVRTVRHNLGSR
ncbi:MAG: hypothetical protein MK102_13915 [Fuerstiella sp.]|nr:hypothetical protein [Fuerstiella sp.]